MCGSARIVVLKSNSDLKDYLKFIIANILPHLLPTGTYGYLKKEKLETLVFWKGKARFGSVSVEFQNLLSKILINIARSSDVPI